MPDSLHGTTLTCCCSVRQNSPLEVTHAFVDIQTSIVISYHDCRGVDVGGRTLAGLAWPPPPPSRAGGYSVLFPQSNIRTLGTGKGEWSLLWVNAELDASLVLPTYLVSVCCSIEVKSPHPRVVDILVSWPIPCVAYGGSSCRPKWQMPAM
ncbi:hypothetical protein LY76DRAFT_61153 [Colletotrichum caudatum]|nr:hypothetical protein LY76DRAFT_61153 [Colletotrichum caudatum]